MDGTRCGRPATRYVGYHLVLSARAAFLLGLAPAVACSSQSELTVTHQMEGESQKKARISPDTSPHDQIQVGRPVTNREV